MLVLLGVESQSSRAILEKLRFMDATNHGAAFLSLYQSIRCRICEQEIDEDMKNVLTFQRLVRGTRTECVEVSKLLRSLEEG